MRRPPFKLPPGVPPGPSPWRIRLKMFVNWLARLLRLKAPLKPLSATSVHTFGEPLGDRQFVARTRRELLAQGLVENSQAFVEAMVVRLRDAGLSEEFIQQCWRRGFKFDES